MGFDSRCYCWNDSLKLSCLEQYLKIRAASTNWATQAQNARGRIRTLQRTRVGSDLGFQFEDEFEFAPPKGAAPNYPQHSWKSLLHRKKWRIRPRDLNLSVILEVENVWGI